MTLFKYDNRLVKKSLREGKLTQKELNEYLKSLPDEAANAEEIKVYEEPTEETKDSNSNLTFF